MFRINHVIAGETRIDGGPVPLVGNVEEVDLHVPLRLPVEDKRVDHVLHGDAQRTLLVLPLFTGDLRAEAGTKAVVQLIGDVGVEHHLRHARRPSLAKGPGRGGGSATVVVRSAAGGARSAIHEEALRVAVAVVVGLLVTEVVLLRVLVGEVGAGVEVAVGLVEGLQLQTLGLDSDRVADQLRGQTGLLEERSAHEHLILKETGF